jgi:hypothetical protein
VSDYFWPGHEDHGWFQVTHSDGEVPRLWWDGSKWADEPFAPWRVTIEQVMEMGYIGVRREPAAQPVEATPDEEVGDALIAQQALDEWRACKQAPKAADWAYKWAVQLCQMLGAE